HRDSLARIGWIGAERGRRAAMEVAIAGEILSHQFRAEHFAILLNEAPVRLIGKDRLGDTGHGERVEKTCDHREGEDEHDRRAYFFQHVSSPQTRCKALTARSIALMPINGMMMPPSP